MDTVINKNLKQYLTEQGYNFPCGGNGLCGKCRILAPAYEVTALDKRFISQPDLARGVRLACDKQYSASYKIVECYMPKAVKKIKLIDPQIIAILGETNTSISIVDNGEVIDYAVFPPTNTELTELYSVIGKNAIEFYEKYGVAKAVCILVAGTAEKMATFVNSYDLSPFAIGDTYSADTFSLPAEEVYLPPIADIAVSSLALMDISVAQDGALIAYLNEKVATVIYKSVSTIAVSTLSQSQNIVSDINEGIFSNDFKCLIATLKYYSGENDCQKVVFIGDRIMQPNLQEMLAAYAIKAELVKSQVATVALDCLTNNKAKTMLNKLARKVIVLSLLDNEDWQNELANL